MSFQSVNNYSDVCNFLNLLLNLLLSCLQISNLEEQIMVLLVIAYGALQQPIPV